MNLILLLLLLLLETILDVNKINDDCFILKAVSTCLCIILLLLAYPDAT